MYLKNGNIIVTSDMNELPISEIKMGQHLILLGTQEVGFNKREAETSTSMVCIHIENDLLWEMEGNSSYVTYNEKDDESIEDVKLEQIIFYRNYLKLKDELYNLGDKDNWEQGFNREYIFDVDDEIHHQLYHDLKTKIFSGNFTKQWFGSMNDNQSKTLYLPIEISEDVCLVFLIKSSFYSFVKWNTSLRACIFNKNKDEVLELSTSFHDLYDKVKELYKYYLNKDEFEKFDLVLDLIKHDIKNHVESSELEQSVMIDKLYDICQLGISKSQLKDLFSFFYQNEELNVQVRVRTLKAYNSGLELYQNGKYVWHHTVMKDPVLKRELLKAEAIHYWDIGNKSGISPYDGKYYVHGELANKPSDYYEDYGGIMYSDSSRKSYYINLDGIFVKMGENKEDVKELIERKRIVERLAN